MEVADALHHSLMMFDAQRASEYEDEVDTHLDVGIQVEQMDRYMTHRHRHEMHVAYSILAHISSPSSTRTHTYTHIHKFVHV